MSDEKPPEKPEADKIAPAGKAGKPGSRDARAERLAEALRANLRRRKQQARARKDKSG